MRKDEFDFLGEFCRYPVLPLKEQELLVRQAKRSKVARDKLVRHNLKLVAKVACRYRMSGLSIPDLCQWGAIGLIEAIERFDPKKNCRFSTCAQHWIRKEITIAVCNYSTTIRLPDHIRDRIRSLKKAAETLQRELGRLPNSEELCDRLGVPRKQIEETLRADCIACRASLEAMMVSDRGNFYREALLTDYRYAPTLFESEAEEVRQLLRAVNAIEPRGTMVLCWRHAEGLTLKECGARLNVSWERAKQLEKKAIAQMRSLLK